jgi:hypothetical protein
MTITLRVLTATLLLATLAPYAAAQTTWTVDDGGAGQFIHIQDAVDASQSGDVILVSDGAYAGFTIDGKSLVVAAEPAADVRLSAFVTVRNLALDQRVELDRLRIGVTFASGGAPSLTLDSNLGSVRVVDCAVLGWSDFVYCSCYYDPALYCDLPSQGAILCQASDEVLLLRCTLQGGHGISNDYDYDWCFNTVGATALTVTASHMNVIGCSILGGGGGDAFDGCWSGSNGGIGLHASQGATVSLYQTTLDGGAGGLGDCCPFTCGSNGGSGGSHYDTVTLSATGLNPNFAPTGLFFQGTLQANGGFGSVLNDGLLCATGEIVRLKGKSATAGAMSFGFGQPNDPQVSVRGSVPAAGGTRTYQLWYRNQPAMFCPPSAFNMSNGVEITWLP